MAVAWHSDCFALGESPVGVVATSGHEHCAKSVNDSDRAVCEAHCNQGDSSPDTARAALSVPALPADAFEKFSLVMRLATRTPHGTPARADAAWHRPTLHPANVLLI
jgi:hypothetical protein